MTSLEVIGAGLGRSGTLSMKLALEILGYGPCHHMDVALQQQPDKIHLWEKIAVDGDEESLKTVFDGFKSTTDYPGCVFYEEFMKLNPDAKVILTVRDSPEVWAESARNTIYPASRFVRLLMWSVSQVHMNDLYYLQYMQACALKKHGVNPVKPETDLAKMYQDWESSVRNTVSQEKLLIYNVKHGWEPLCEFLGVPVPEIEFPAVNSTEAFKKRNNTRVIMRRSLTKIAVIGILIVGVAAVVELTSIFK